MTDDALSRRWAVLRGLLNEQQRRRWAGIEAEALGANGVQIVANATGLAWQTVKSGLEDVQNHREGNTLDASFLDPALDQREAGGGRKRGFPDLASALTAQMERQDPGRVWRTSVFNWTCLSLRQLADKVAAQSARASHTTISASLDGLGFRTVTEPWAPRRHNAETRLRQYRVIADAVTCALDAAQPVVVLNLSKALRDTERVIPEERDERSPMSRADQALSTALWGRESWNDSGDDEVSPRDGWTTGVPDAHTTGLAAETVRHWWERHGREYHEKSGEVLVVANALGFGGETLESWQSELGRFSVESGIGVRVCYLPPGICRWSHCAHQLGAILAIQDLERKTARHKVICKVIDWTSLPEHASEKLRHERRPAGRVNRPHWRRPAPVSIRRQRPDAAEPDRDWDFAISPGP